METFLTILLLVSWACAIWGLLVFIMRGLVLLIHDKGGINGSNMIWAALSILFILFRLLPQIGLDL